MLKEVRENSSSSYYITSFVHSDMVPVWCLLVFLSLQKKCDHNKTKAAERLEHNTTQHNTTQHHHNITTLSSLVSRLSLSLLSLSLLSLVSLSLQEMD